MPQPGRVVPSAIVPCQTTAVVVVTVQYGAGAGPYDVDVDLDIACVAKQRDGNVFTFQIANPDDEGAFEVVLRSHRWSRRADYLGGIEANRVTSVVAQVELHAIQITAKDTDYFIPNDEHVQLSYAITGEPETVQSVDLVVLDRQSNEVERHRVPGPYQAAATFDWSGALARTLQESPFTLRMELTSDVGTQCQSNDETVEIQIERVQIALDDARVQALPPGREREVLMRLRTDFLGNPRVGRILYDSPLFKLNGTEMNDDTSFTEYRALWGAGIEVPFLVTVNFQPKAGAPRRVPRLLAGTRVLWDVTLLSDGEEDAALDDRGVHPAAKAFWKQVAGQDVGGTAPRGHTAIKDLGGMRSPANARGPNQEHWRQLDPAWVYTRPAQRRWAAYTLCDGAPNPNADSGIKFRGGRIAGDIHHLRAFVQHETDLDRTDASLNNIAPLETRSGPLELQNWRVVFISENYWVGGGLDYFDAAPLRAQYDKAAVLITRGNGFLGGDKTVEWRTEYQRLVHVYYGQSSWASHAMLDQCGDHPAAFRSYSAYLDRALPGFSNLPKRAMAMLSSTDEAEYKRKCDQISAAFIKFLMWNLFPSAASAAAPLMPPGGRPPPGPAGLTVVQFAGIGQYNLEAEHGEGTYTGGWAPFFDRYNQRDKACFLTFAGTTPDPKTMVHEIGHHLFLAHAPGHFQVGVQPAGCQPDAHAANERCLMSYHRDKEHLCGLCLMKLAGYDYLNHIRPDGSVV